MKAIPPTTAAHSSSKWLCRSFDDKRLTEVRKGQIMFTTKAFRAMVVCLLVFVLFALEAQAQRKKQIAVLDFDFATVDIGLAHRAYGGQENLARRVSEKLMNSLVALGTCQVVERSRLEKVLNEQNLGIDGRIDPSTAAKVGRVLGVDALVIGSVSAFDLLGLPKNDSDTYWDAKGMRARIAVNFRIVDTTTAVVELGNEMIGMSAQPKTSAGTKIFRGLLDQHPEVKDEQIRDVVQQAVDDVINKITEDVEKYLSGARRQPEPLVQNQIIGRVIKVNGPSLIITGIDKAAVRIGDRLYVRRTQVSRDPGTNKEIRYTEKVGEVEVIEIQDQVIIGSFAGSDKAQVDDTVTNNPTGPSISQPGGQTKAPSPASDNPSRSPDAGDKERAPIPNRTPPRKRP